MPNPTTEPIRRLAVEWLRARPLRERTRETLADILDHVAYTYAVEATPACLDAAWMLVPVWDRMEAAS